MTKITAPIQVVVAAFDGALASAITGIVDLLSMAGVSWHRIQQQPIQRLFEVKIASSQGQPIRCVHGLCLEAQMSYAQIHRPDILIVPTIGGPIGQTLAQHPELCGLLQRAAQQHWIIAGNCTGSFFLAEAGILDGRLATTHWGFQDAFRQRYPQVKLHAEQMMSRDGDIYCAGGGGAWFDLGLHFVERFYGGETAVHTARAFVIDYRRDSQLSYAALRVATPHQDLLIQQIQDWLALNFHQLCSLEELATRFNLTVRTLIRRFKAALGMPPNRYLQIIRIEAAQKRLQETAYPVDEIMQQVGYHDPSSFRRLFRQHTGLTPLEYRQRFSHAWSFGHAAGNTALSSRG